LTAVSGRIAEFRDRGCDVLGISTDSVETHERWLTTPPGQGGMGPLTFPLAADVGGNTCQNYGVYLERQQVAMRGLFLIDPNGVLQLQVVHSLSIGRNTDEILRVLDGLQTGGACAGERKIGEPVIDASRELVPGRVVGPYRIEEELGGGSFGTVFRAHDRALDREVALKVLRPGSPIPPAALLAEARTAAALNHPNICIIYAVDSSEGVPMIVMEYIAGQPLSKLIGQGPMQPDQVMGLGRQVAQGMAAAHTQGVIHGDLKPANVLVTAAGLAKVVDFGMARRKIPADPTDATLVWTPARGGGISGTPAYMAPEQARGQAATPASDVFSLGVILLEMVTGRHAREAENLFELLRRIDREDLTSGLSEVPEPFAAVLRPALAVNPAERHITMAQIAEQLGEVTAPF
jgi:serine/threonine protein kinase/peroxiredoxin